MAYDKFGPQKAAIATVKANANASASVPALRAEVANLCDQVSALLDTLTQATSEPNPANEPRAMIIDNT